MAFNIREARPDDARYLARIHSESWRAAFKDIVGAQAVEHFADETRARELYEHVLTSGLAHGYIGEADGDACCMAFWSQSRDGDMEGCAEIICMHSLPEYWRRGHGRRMMEKLLHDISEAGFKKVMLWVFCDNTRARALYEKSGFRPTEKTRSDFGAQELCYEL